LGIAQEFYFMADVSRFLGFVFLWGKYESLGIPEAGIFSTKVQMKNE